MNTAAAKQTIKQHIQTLKDEQLQQYHLTHDCFTGRPFAAHRLPQLPEHTVDTAIQKKQRDIDSLNKVLHPAPTLGSVLGDALAVLKPAPVIPDATDATQAEKPSADLLNRARHWFDQYRTKGLESLLPEQSCQLSEANIALIKKAFSRNTLLIQNVCILSAFWIRSPLDWDAKGETDLLEHLFVHYDTPPFLKACWSQATDEENIRWLLCFIFYAQGGSLKALANYFGWTTATNKLWHQLYVCPPGMSPLHAVLYAEFKRLGGWDEDFACLMANESYVIDLLEPASEAGREFWYDTCRWTISLQFELLPSETRQVLWWARHQFTEYARQGESYRLQGRSKAKVQESIAAYEQEQRQIRQARARMAERARQVSMAREEERARLREEFQQEQAIREALVARQNGDYDDYDEPIDAVWKKRGWDWSTLIQGKKWRFIELSTTKELYDEGESMEHCVGGYSLSCVDGYAAIFSLRCEGKRKVTIEIDPASKQLTQVQGKFNAEPVHSVLSVVDVWMKRIVRQ